MKRRIRPVERKATIEWTAHGEGYVSADGRFTVCRSSRGGWLLTDTKEGARLKEQATRSPEHAQDRAEEILESEKTWR